MAGTDGLTPMIVAQADSLEQVTMTTPGTIDPSLDRVLYYHTDAIGSVRVATDKNGQVVQRYDYTPFGTEWQASTDRESRRFTAQQWDEETGLGYFGARHYNSKAAGFTTPDDAAFIDLLNPASINLYGYAFANPLKYNDPTGHSADCFGAFDAKTGLCEPVSFDRGLFDFSRASMGRVRTAAAREPKVDTSQIIGCFVQGAVNGL